MFLQWLHILIWIKWASKREQKAPIAVGPPSWFVTVSMISFYRLVHCVVKEDRPRTRKAHLHHFGYQTVAAEGRAQFEVHLRR